MPLKFVEFSPKFDYRVALLLLSLEQQLASADFPIAIFGHCTTTREIDATLWRGEVCLGSWGPLVYLYHVIYYRHSTSLGAQVLELWKEGGARLHATFFKILQFFFCFYFILSFSCFCIEDSQESWEKTTEKVACCWHKAFDIETTVSLAREESREGLSICHYTVVFCL